MRVTNGGSENLVAQISERVREALLEAEQRGSEFVAEAEQRAGEVVAAAERRREEIVAEAEERAREIVAEAEASARRTRGLAEEQARERIDRARAALEEIGGSLSAENASTAAPTQPTVVSQPEPTVATEPLPSEPEAEPEDAAEPASEPADSSLERSHDGPEVPHRPSTEDLIATLRGGSNAAGAADDTAARLVAMNMALDGAAREDIDRHLAEIFEVPNREALLDEVFSRAGR